MDLIDRYVKAVSRRLSPKRRADVELELRWAILDEVEGRGATTEDEVAAVLREFGDPETVAAGYRPEGQYLIGPDLYPSYLRVLRHALAAVVALSGLRFAVRSATSYEPMAVVGDELLNAFDLAVEGAIGAALVVTVAFIVMQRAGAKVPAAPDEFDPRTLPAVLEADRVSRTESAFSLVVLAVAMAILGTILYETQRGVGAAPEVLRPLIRGAAVASIPWLIASMLVEAVMQAGLVVEGRRRIGWRVLHVVSDALAVVGFGLAGMAVLVERAALETIGVPAAAALTLGVTLLVVALVIGVSAFVRERRLTRRRAQELVGAVPLPSSPAAAMR